MFINSIFDALKSKQIWFQWKTTLLYLLNMDITTIEWRLKMLLYIVSLFTSLWITTVKDWKNPTPDLEKIKRIIIQSNNLVHSNVVIVANMKTIVQELSFEIISATNWKWDISLIEDIYSKKIDPKEFLNIKQKTTLFNKVFSFVWLNWKTYSWTWVQDLLNFNTEDFIDMVSWLKITNEIKDILLDSWLMKKEFKNHRAWMMWYIKACIDPESSKWNVVKFIYDKIWYDWITTKPWIEWEEIKDNNENLSTNEVDIKLDF